MLAFANANGEILKPLQFSTTYGLHPLFGLIPVDQLAERLRRRAIAGVKSPKIDWTCKFKVDGDNLSDITGCQVQKVNESNANKGAWKLITSVGEFMVLPVANAKPAFIPVQETDSKVQSKKIALVFLLIFSILMLPYFFQQKPKEIVIEPPQEAVVVKLVQTPKTVVIQQNLPTPIQKSDQQVKRAVQQNLGFLGLIGKKDLSKALGGVPTQIKDASAGAGKGGSEGSGGELLVGLGQGVKHTTVGNTGTAGLGGIGTKGRGGGAGGYGNTMIGSGEGRTLSKVALSQDLVLDGGLDRAVIQATIAKYLSQVRACYEAELLKNPGIAGQVNTFFVINGGGAVKSSVVKSSTLGNANVEGCITTKMLTWNFPKPVGGVDVKVNYPFVLRPVGN